MDASFFRRNVWGMPGLECHFLVSDAKGSAVIEFVNNNTVVSVEKMLEHMKKAWYSQIYFPGNEAKFASEMNGDFSAEGFGDMTIFAESASAELVTRTFVLKQFRGDSPLNSTPALLAQGVRHSAPVPAGICSAASQRELA